MILFNSLSKPENSVQLIPPNQYHTIPMNRIDMTYGIGMKYSPAMGKNEIKE